MWLIFNSISKLIFEERSNDDDVLCSLNATTIEILFWRVREKMRKTSQKKLMILLRKKWNCIFFWVILLMMRCTNCFFSSCRNFWFRRLNAKFLWEKKIFHQGNFSTKDKNTSRFLLNLNINGIRIIRAFAINLKPFNFTSKIRILRLSYLKISISF